MKSLTPRQQQVLDFIHHASRQDGTPPTLREIAAHFGFRSVKAATDHVNALRRKNALAGKRRRARALRIVSPWPDRRSAIANIPLYGSIPAGFARDQPANLEGCLSIDLDSLGIRPTPRTFALQVRGDSMIGRSILDGDYVILEHGRTPRNGDIVAALIDNESTLKTFVQERGRPPYLKAENPRYPRLYPVGELVIQGVLLALIRQFEGRRKTLQTP